MRRSVVILLVGLVVAGCSPEEAELVTTTTLSTADEVETTTTTPESDTTTPPLSGVDDDNDEVFGGVPEYEIVVRSSATEGETLWVLVEAGDHTDVDLENIIRVIVDTSDFDLDGIRVFDDADALEAGRLDDAARTDEEQALVDEHFLVSLEDGAVIRFRGPYADFGEIAVGS